MVLRESIIMKIHYGTALGALFLTVIHIIMRLTQDFKESLEYENVIANYESVGYAINAAIPARHPNVTTFSYVGP